MDLKRELARVKRERDFSKSEAVYFAKESHETYGSPRMCTEFQARGCSVNGVRLTMNLLAGPN